MGRIVHKVPRPNQKGLVVANHASAEKRNRQRIKRTLRNRAVKSSVRTLVKKVRAALDAKNRVEAEKALVDAIVALDRAATKGVVHVKAASRSVARLSSAVHKLRVGTPKKA
jgi:small subunit ribosomal protein S20